MYTNLIGAVGTLDDVIASYVPDPVDVQKHRLGRSNQSTNDVKSKKKFYPHKGTKIRKWDHDRETYTQYVDRVRFSNLRKLALKLMNDEYRLRNKILAPIVLSYLLRYYVDEVDCAARRRAAEELNEREGLTGVDRLVAKRYDDLELTPEELEAFLRGDFGHRKMTIAERFRRRHLDQQCENAAMKSYQAWKPEHDAEMRQRASNAGKKGKAYTLADHVNTAHMTVTEAHRALGIARGTVYAMRREFADIDIATGEVHEAITPTTQPVSAVADRLGAEAGAADWAGLGGLAGDDQAGGSAPDPDASRPTAVAEGSRRILLDLDSLRLPF